MQEKLIPNFWDRVVYMLLFWCRYSASVSHKGNGSYDDYNLKYKSIKLTVDDEPTFTSLGFKCDQTVKSGSSYNIQYGF